MDDDDLSPCVSRTQTTMVLYMDINQPCLQNVMISTTYAMFRNDWRWKYIFHMIPIIRSAWKVLCNDGFISKYFSDAHRWILNEYCLRVICDQIFIMHEATLIILTVIIFYGHVKAIVKVGSIFQPYFCARTKTHGVININPQIIPLILVISI